MSLKEKVLELKSKGLNQSQIVEKLGCARSTVCWHFNPEKQLKKAQLDTRVSLYSTFKKHLDTLS